MEGSRYVNFDTYTGNIASVREGCEWYLDEQGHRHKELGKEYVTGTGKLLLKSWKGTSGLMLFDDEECEIRVDGNKTYARLRVGNFNGISLVFTVDGEAYVVSAKEWPLAINSAYKLDMHEFVTYKQRWSQVLNQIGDFSKMKTRQTSLIDAFNELLERVETPRHIVGWANYLVRKLDDYERITSIKDLDLMFNKMMNRWEYWSEPTESFISLPVGWQKLKYIVRDKMNLNHFDIVDIENGDMVGVIADDTVYRYDDDVLIKVSAPKNEVGDEYIIQRAFDEDRVTNGILVYTNRGWVEILK